MKIKTKKVLIAQQIERLVFAMRESLLEEDTPNKIYWYEQRRVIADKLIELGIPVNRDEL